MIVCALSDHVAGVGSILAVKTYSQCHYLKLTAPSLSTSGWLIALKETPSDRQPSVSKQSCIPSAQTCLTSAHICLQQQCKVAPMCNHLSLKDVLFFRNATAKCLYAISVFYLPINHRTLIPKSLSLFFVFKHYVT